MVERYSMSVQGPFDRDPPILEPDNEGDWVRHSDYARLQEQLEAANARNVEHEMRLEAEESKSAHWINENRHNLKAGQDAAYKLEAAEARIARLEIVALALADHLVDDVQPRHGLFSFTP